MRPTPQEKTRMNDKTLEAIFSVAGVRNGYDDVQAEFTPFRDFKIKWTRSYSWIAFEVSDYLSDAPEEVIQSLASTIFRKLKGDKESLFTKPVVDWITSADFLRRKQPVFVERFRGLTTTTVGDRRDLRESYDRLVEMGLVERDPDVFIGWSTEAPGRVVGRSSTLMKVVAMSGLLDTREVSDELMDYCLYTQLAHVGLGFRPGAARMGPDYDRALSLYPGRHEMDRELRRIGMHI